MKQLLVIYRRLIARRAWWSRPLLVSVGIALSGLASAQQCDENLRNNVPTERFVVHRDGTVTDRVTGLNWQRCAVGQSWIDGRCDEDRKRQVRSWFSWTDAKRQVQRLQAMPTYQGWRLPTVEELRTLVDRHCIDPAINTEIFPGAPAWYFWSVSEYGVNPDYAWQVDFKGGEASTHLKNGQSYHIRLVKGELLAAAKKRRGEATAVERRHDAWEDGIHDPANPDIQLLQNPTDATRDLPRDSRGEVDWAAALLNGAIQPRAALEDSAEGAAGMVVWDQDILYKDTATMPHVRFPHKLHSMWLACENCHSEIFATRRGEAEISMGSIYEGRHCGACHGRVAFSPNSCERCHSVLHEGSPTKWW